jgi:3-methyladenine DNA glycosylase AlkC
MADIPPAVLRQLNAGEIETVTLVEWLAIDCRKLAASLASHAHFKPFAHDLNAAAKSLAALGIQARTKGMGAALHALLSSHPRNLGRDAAFEALATHPSDMVRAWTGYSIGADTTLTLPARFKIMRRFAADNAMSVRECAWDSLRPFLSVDLPRALELLRPWVRDEHFAVRRCAIEATRPRGVWCAHIQALKDDPAPALPLLEAVRADSADYVRRSAANWLNDASKSRPDWVRGVCARWLKESPLPETAWICNHALRTLRKKQA